VEQYLPELEGVEERSKFKKDRDKVRRILTESIKDNQIPYISELKNPNESIRNIYDLKKSTQSN